MPRSADKKRRAIPCLKLFLFVSMLSLAACASKAPERPLMDARPAPKLSPQERVANFERIMDMKDEAVAATLMDTARQYLGVRYRYGGVTPKGFDCSGLTRHLFAKFGSRLPRNSSSQAKVGVAVDRDDLRPGDLVFFATRGRGRINHVGVYIGDGEMVHASRSKGVTVDSLDEPYYARRYVTARRHNVATLCAPDMATRLAEAGDRVRNAAPAAPATLGGPDREASGALLAAAGAKAVALHDDDSASMAGARAVALQLDDGAYRSVAMLTAD